MEAPCQCRVRALVEREMSAVIGGASARLILDVAKMSSASLRAGCRFVDEASQVLINRDLLQSTIENNKGSVD